MLVYNDWKPKSYPQKLIVKTSFSCIYNEYELQLNFAQTLYNKLAVYIFIYWCERRGMCKNKTPEVRLGLWPFSGVQSENSNLCGAIIQMEGVCTCGQGWAAQGSEIESVVWELCYS